MKYTQDFIIFSKISKNFIKINILYCKSIAILKFMLYI
ncbi:hypothetical protein FSU_1482 [Fibrobacter succinogenes subsp. succinogenes S85]|uniref:Uncharacterized protein n=1 Tax=Fibrobacter succinogenes (strain ATCC 19169 / S85) TaxID=59374 RepID=D9SAD9_FIBSS|nr:hypothetical protein FSU_1482 [Fibrobacter succinogenes subsp. succinogenes S85]